MKNKIVNIILVILLVSSIIQVTPIDDGLIGKVSAGSTWTQSTQGDFQAGTGNNVLILPDGNVSLALQTKYVEDDFLNESMISSKRNVMI